MSSCTYTVMFKILQARLQQYKNHELPDVQAAFRKGRGTRDQIANIRWIIKKAREFQKNIYFCFIDYAKAFDCVGHNKLENSSRNGNTRLPDLGSIPGLGRQIILERVACPFLRGTSRLRNQTGVSCISGGFFTS